MQIRPSSISVEPHVADSLRTQRTPQTSPLPQQVSQSPPKPAPKEETSQAPTPSQTPSTSQAQPLRRNEGSRTEEAAETEAEKAQEPTVQPTSPEGGLNVVA